MKKLLVLLSLLLLLSITACNSSPQKITIIDGAYSCTTSEFNSMLHNASKSAIKQGKSLIECPVVENPIYITISDNICFELSSGENGKLSEIKLSWNNRGLSGEEYRTVSFLYGFIVGQLSPGSGDWVAEQLDVSIDKKHDAATSVTDNGTYYNFYGALDTNYIVFRPSEA